ncbi:MAG: peptidoglycan DD-metalloendopeptidase family protein [Deltaproteobacteria bacterium]|nr:peptidoglycan DD-metalloendopeptidase family protein [Nannocystaceae bacterium]
MTQRFTVCSEDDGARSKGGQGHAFGMLGLAGALPCALVCALICAPGCYTGHDGGGEPFELDGGDEDDDGLDVDETPNSTATCGPRMSVFPVGEAHNIGYDASCGGPGGCPVSCPDVHANSDWNPAATHNGIDVFAREGAPLVAVADGVVISSGTPSNTSGLRVKIRDACGWNYYYGHMLSSVVQKGDHVGAGQLIGYMGRSGAASTHLHFNVSAGDYLDDINPFDLLHATSPTACGGEPPAPPPEEPPPPVEPPQPPPPPPEAGCGLLVPNQAIGVDQAIYSCDNRFTLVLQSDGNIVQYWNGTSTAIWNAGTVGQPANALVMQDDGNLVLYSAAGAPLWHTQTNGRPGSYLSLDDNGALIIFEGATPVWWNGTGGL